MIKALALGVSALLWSTAASATQWAAGAHAAPRVAIFLDFEHAPSKPSVQLMQREVGAVLAATGVQFSWLTLKQDVPSETFDELAVLRFRGSCRIDKLRLPAVIPDAGPVTLGETDLTSGVVSVYSSVECDEIKTCIAGALGGFCERDRETAFGRALGRVVAHELYHILGRTREHSRHGISRGLQTSFDLIRENFQFDRKALLWLKQRLQIVRTAAPGKLASERGNLTVGAGHARRSVSP
jgi:hypothetical protein